MILRLYLYSGGTYMKEGVIDLRSKCIGVQSEFCELAMNMVLTAHFICLFVTKWRRLLAGKVATLSTRRYCASCCLSGKKYWAKSIPMC